MQLNTILVLITVMAASTKATDIIFFEDLGCDDFAEACWDVNYEVCCSANEILGSASLQDAPFLSELEVTSSQNGDNCALTIGKIFNLWCFDSVYYSVTGAYWDYEFILDADLANSTALTVKRGDEEKGAKKCQATDTYVLRSDDTLYAIKKDSNEGKQYKDMTSKADRRAFMLANSHVTKTWQTAGTTETLSDISTRV